MYPVRVRTQTAQSGVEHTNHEAVFVWVLENLESPRIFVVAFSRTGKSWKMATGPGKFWKSVKLK